MSDKPPLTPERREELIRLLAGEDKLPPLTGFVMAVGRAMSRREVAEVMVACWEKEHTKPMVH